MHSDNKQGVMVGKRKFIPLCSSKISFDKQMKALEVGHINKVFLLECLSVKLKTEKDFVKWI